jgi:hypothetical protein
MYCAVVQYYTLWLLSGVSILDFTDFRACDFESCLEYWFIGTERLRWVEESTCTRFVTGVKTIIL